MFYLKKPNLFKAGLISLLFVAASTLKAQNKVTPPYEIKTDTLKLTIADGKYWQVLPDATGRLAFPEVTAMPFKPVKGQMFAMDIKVHTYWMRYRVKNILNHTVNLVIPDSISRADLFVLHPTGKVEKMTTGTAVLWSQRTGYKRLQQFNIAINAGEEITFYERNYINPILYTYSGSILSLKVVKHPEADLIRVYENIIDKSIRNSYLFGFSLLAAIISLFFFIVSREKLYLYFSLFTFSFGGLTFNNSTYNLFFKNSPELTDYLSYLFVCSMLFFLWRFLSHFYQTRLFFPRWTKVINMVSYICPVLSVCTFLQVYTSQQYLNDLVVVLFMLYGINSFVVLICSAIKNTKKILFNIIATLPLVAGALAIVLLTILRPDIAGSAQFTNWVPFVLSSAYCWLIIMFFWDLIQRFQKLTRQNEVERTKLIAAQKIELEQQVKERTQQLNQSLERSDSLLLNILPADVAEELKETGSANARMFDEVTVLFTDFVNFTTISELLSPQELVDELHHCFKAFDDIMATNSIEKIKTIGDAYLAVAGLPNADANHAANAIKAAQEIQQFIHTRKAELGDRTFDIRIGIHSGSVVAGIVGVKKFAYDIWGDTVNTAARMEQNSEPGKTNVSEKTYELVKDQFAFTYRGEIEAKNKGALKMYFVKN